MATVREVCVPHSPSPMTLGRARASVSCRGRSRRLHDHVNVPYYRTLLDPQVSSRLRPYTNTTAGEACSWDCSQVVSTRCGATPCGELPTEGIEALLSCYMFGSHPYARRI